jgi:hypothetical protein
VLTTRALYRVLVRRKVVWGYKQTDWVGVSEMSWFSDSERTVNWPATRIYRLVVAALGPAWIPVIMLAVTLTTALTGALRFLLLAGQPSDENEQATSTAWWEPLYYSLTYNRRNP